MRGMPSKPSPAQSARFRLLGRLQLLPPRLQQSDVAVPARHVVEKNAWAAEEGRQSWLSRWGGKPFEWACWMGRAAEMPR